MRIGLVGTELFERGCVDGGLAVYSHRLAMGLRRLGHEPVVFGPGLVDSEKVESGVIVHTVDCRMSSLQRLARNLSLRRLTMLINLVPTAYRLARRLEQVHMENPFDIVQYTHLGGVGLFRSYDIPSVVRVSSSTPLCRLKGGYDHQSRFAMFQQEALERRAMRKADALFGPGRIVSAAVAADIGREIEVIESPFFVENDGEDPSVYETNLGGADYLLFVGRLSRLKGVLEIADILEDLLQKWPRLRFVFVGNEQAGYRGSSMADWVRGRAGPHSDRVLMLGQLEHRQLFPVLRHARCVVLPSLIDNFPNTCLEAMACRRIVVGTRGTSFEQLLIDGESGYLCTPGDAKSLMAAIDRALSLDPAEAEAMGAAGAHTLQRLRPEEAIARHLEFYGRTVDAFRRHPAVAGVRRTGSNS